MRTALLLFFLYLGLTLQGQSVLRGQIYLETGEPAPFVSVVVKGNPSLNTASDSLGFFTLEVPSEKPFILQFQHLTIKEKEVAVEALPAGETFKTFRVTSDVTQFGPVDVVRKSERDREQAGTVRIEVKQTLPNPSGSFETMLLAQAPGIRASNELSSTYSVRGGNFDENLVYVNGFEIYRPFLIRSGQQEGLSFINPDMVQSVSFSSGGFQAKYGDKLSSVLDVDYRRPEHFAASGSASLLGGTVHIEGASKNHRAGIIAGARNKSLGYLLSSQDVTGEYTPRFFDVQSLAYVKLNERWRVEHLFNFARNRFDFIPEDRTTDFGLVNFQARFQVFYQGQENDAYQTTMNGLTLAFEPNDKLQLRWLGAAFLMREQERFDLIGEYFLGEVETDFSSENFNEVRRELGAGTFHDWARNELYTQVYQAGHLGSFNYKKGQNLEWGLRYKREHIDDVLSEWQRIDSAGYALPNDPNQVVLNDVVKSRFQLQSNRFSGFIQNSHRWGDSTRFTLHYGLRTQYWDVNKEWLFSPRAQFSVRPNTKADLVFSMGGGLYHQPPFYREMRNLQGQVNTDLLAQKSTHAIVGMDYGFEAWNRPFRFLAEAYYKYMWDLVPFEYDNVLIRYNGENRSKGYAAGVDLRLHGELAEGMESWISLSFLKTEEDIEDDQFINYLIERRLLETDSGFVSTRDTLGTESVFPGNIPRPTDSRFGFALFFQDYIPGLEWIRVHMNLAVAGGLPFGPPDGERYQDVFRIPVYRRLDMGVSALLFDQNRLKEKGRTAKKLMRPVNKMWLSLEAYNVLAIQNTISYLWVRGLDIGTGQTSFYAVPNYLTGRRFNLRFRVEF